MDPVTSPPLPSDTFSDVEDYNDPAGFNEMMGGLGGLGGLMDMFGGGAPAGEGAVPAAGSTGFSTSTASILDQLLLGDPAGYEALKLEYAGLTNDLATEARGLDLSDPLVIGPVKQALAAVFQQVEEFMATNGNEVALMEGLGLLLGLTDTLHPSLVLAEADIVVGEPLFSDLIQFYDVLTAQFEAPGDLEVLLNQALQGVHEHYLDIMSTAAELGVEVQTLSEVVPESAPTDPTSEPGPDPLNAPLGDDTLPGDAAALPPETSDPFGAEPAGEDDPLAALEELMNPSGETEPTDPFAPTEEPSDPFADPLGDDPFAPEGEEDPFGALEDLLDPAGAVDPADPLDPLAALDPLGGDGTSPLPDEVREGQLSPESSTADSPNGDPSAQNQANLEARFINLYENLMEKQISFKEAVEAFKTDNQNAAKG